MAREGSLASRYLIRLLICAINKQADRHLQQDGRSLAVPTLCSSGCLPLQEMYTEYSECVQRCSAHGPAPRLRVFLFPASEEDSWLLSPEEDLYACNFLESSEYVGLEEVCPNCCARTSCRNNGPRSGAVSLMLCCGLGCLKAASLV